MRMVEAIGTEPEDSTGAGAHRRTPAPCGTRRTVARRVRVVVCGFGRVGRTFARLLEDKRGVAARTHGLALDLVGVGELSGSLLAPAGLAPGETADLTWQMRTGQGQTGPVRVSVTPGIATRDASSTATSACAS